MPFAELCIDMHSSIPTGALFAKGRSRGIKQLPSKAVSNFVARGRNNWPQVETRCQLSVRDPRQVGLRHAKLQSYLAPRAPRSPHPRAPTRVIAGRCACAVWSRHELALAQSTNARNYSARTHKSFETPVVTLEHRAKHQTFPHERSLH